jgi:hypothetical protein
LDPDYALWSIVATNYMTTSQKAMQAGIPVTLTFFQSRLKIPSYTNF